MVLFCGVGGQPAGSCATGSSAVLPDDQQRAPALRDPLNQASDEVMGYVLHTSRASEKPESPAVRDVLATTRHPRQRVHPTSHRPHQLPVTARVRQGCPSADGGYPSTVPLNFTTFLTQNKSDRLTCKTSGPAACVRAYDR